MADASPRPVVTLDPAVNFGRAHIRGVLVDAITGRLNAGDAAAAVADEFGLSRADLLVACWHAARYGGKRRRSAWRGWLAAWEETLWLGGYDPADVPLPTEPAGAVDGP